MKSLDGDHNISQYVSAFLCYLGLLLETVDDSTSVYYPFTFIDHFCIGQKKPTFWVSPLPGDTSQNIQCMIPLGTSLMKFAPSLVILNKN